MRKKVIQLTDSELSDLIAEAINGVQSYSRIHPTSCTTVHNDDIIGRTNVLEPHVQQHWLKDYIGKTFKFFAKDAMGLVVHVLFTFDKIIKLDANKTILVGDVVFRTTKIIGDSIMIDFTKNRVQYRKYGSRETYDLEIDNRVKPLWDSLLEQIHGACRSREMKLSVINLALFDRPDTILEFVEHNDKTNRSYSVDLTNISVKFIDHIRCVFQGQLTVVNKPFGNGTIEYQFNTGEFYRVSYSDKTIRSRKLHSLILHNKNEGKELLSLIADLYSREDEGNNALSKMDKGEDISIVALCQGVKDTFPNFSLEFVEYDKNTNEGYGVDLKVESIKFIDNSRCVIQGGLTVANRPFGVGTIEYQFDTDEFYRVSYSDKTTRSRKLHSLVLHNKNEGKELLSFIADLYSRMRISSN